MFALYNTFQTNRINNKIKISNHRFSKVINEFSYQIIQKDDHNIIQEINQIKINHVILILDKNSYLNEQYIILCFNKMILITLEKDISLIEPFFRNNKDSKIFNISENDEEILFLKSIGISQPGSNEFIINLKEEIENFSTQFQITNKEHKFFWSFIRPCISGYLILNARYNSFVDRISNCEDFFQSTEKIDFEEDDFIKLGKIESGSTSSIELLYHIEKEKLFVFKRLLSVDEHERLSNREQRNYEKVHHPFLLKCYGQMQFTDSFGLILEYINGTTLKSIEKVDLNLNEKLKILFEIMIVIEYLHNNNYIYRDLKLDNVMIDQSKVAILIDLDRMINDPEQKSYDLSSSYQLGLFYSLKNEFYDNKKAFHYFTLAANQQYSKAQYSLGFLYYDTKNENYDLNKSIHYFKLAAEQKDANACFNLSLIYEKENDIEKSMHYLNLSADLKNPEALFKIGFLYEKNQHDIKKAIHYYELASEENSSKAQYKLGLIYSKGKHVIRDMTKAIHYLTLASENDDPSAQSYLGYLYEKGQFVECDINKAVNFYIRAAKQNDSNAQLCLGRIYEEGKFVRPDIDKAIYYYTLSANQDNPSAQCNLGLIYLLGKYGKFDKDKSINFLLRAANHDYLDALYYLGLIYYKSG